MGHQLVVLPCPWVVITLRVANFNYTAGNMWDIPQKVTGITLLTLRMNSRVQDLFRLHHGRDIERECCNAYLASDTPAEICIEQRKQLDNRFYELYTDHYVITVSSYDYHLTHLASDLHIVMRPFSQRPNGRDLRYFITTPGWVRGFSLRRPYKPTSDGTTVRT